MNDSYFYKRIRDLRYAEKILEENNIKLNINFIIEDLLKEKEEEGKLREEIKLNPDDYKLHTKFGDILQDLEEYEEAEKEYQEALRINPDSYEAHNSLGILFYKLKRYEEAEKEYRKALKLNPEYAVVHYNLGNLLDDLQRYDEVYNEYKLAVKQEPEFAELLLYLAVISSNKKELKRKLILLKNLFIEIDISEKINEIEKLLNNL